MAYLKIFPVKFQFALFLLVAFFIPPSLQAAEKPSQIYFSHALKLKEEGRFLAAERLLRKAIEVEPENADYHFELGNLYIEQNDSQRAKLEYEQAIMILPEHLPAHYNLGLVYRDLGFMSDARQEFHRVLDLDPSNVKAQLQIGNTYQKEGFPDEARQAFETAQEMDITNTEPQDALEDLKDHEQQIAKRAQRQEAVRRDTLMQAGGFLLEELRSRRLQNRDDSKNPS